MPEPELVIGPGLPPVVLHDDSDPTADLLLGVPAEGTVKCPHCDDPSLERVADHGVWATLDGVKTSVSAHVHRPRQMVTLKGVRGRVLHLDD